MVGDNAGFGPSPAAFRDMPLVVEERRKVLLSEGDPGAVEHRDENIVEDLGSGTGGRGRDNRLQGIRATISHIRSPPMRIYPQANS
jgi:hypothetical protein